MTAASRAEARERILEFVVGFHAEHGVAPTVRQVAERAGLSSSSRAHEHLLALAAEGKLINMGNRGFVPVREVQQ